MKKKRLIIGAIIVLLGVFLIMFLSKNQIFFDKEYPVSVEAISFSPEGDRIKLGIVSTEATKDTLTLRLSLSGIDLSGVADFDHLICDPNISTKENVAKTLKSRDVVQGDPLQVTYVYQLLGNSYRTLNVDMDWTIGPCDIALNESNVTPVPEPLLTNYHFTFAVPVK